MNLYIIIPAHNEDNYLSATLESLVNQSYLPKKLWWWMTIPPTILLQS